MTRPASVFDVALSALFGAVGVAGLVLFGWVLRSDWAWLAGAGLAFAGYLAVISTICVVTDIGRLRAGHEPETNGDDL